MVKFVWKPLSQTGFTTQLSSLTRYSTRGKGGRPLPGSLSPEAPATTQPAATEGQGSPHPSSGDACLSIKSHKRSANNRNYKPVISILTPTGENIHKVNIIPNCPDKHTKGKLAT